MSIVQGYSSVGRAAVSKTVGRGFESCCPCHFFCVAAPPRGHALRDARLRFVAAAPRSGK